VRRGGRATTRVSSASVTERCLKRWCGCSAWRVGKGQSVPLPRVRVGRLPVGPVEVERVREARRAVRRRGGVGGVDRLKRARAARNEGRRGGSVGPTGVEGLEHHSVDCLLGICGDLSNKAMIACADMMALVECNPDAGGASPYPQVWGWCGAGIGRMCLVDTALGASARIDVVEVDCRVKDLKSLLR
jgi:hypothetical protein